MIFSDPKKTQRQIIATKWNDTHKTTVDWDMDSIFKAPKKPLHINRSPNQLTTKSPRPKKKKSPIKTHVKQESNSIKQSKKSTKKRNHSKKSGGIHFVSGGLVRPK